MDYTYRLHPKADEDYATAYAWYENKQLGLGEQFIIAVRERIESISLQPEVYGSKENKNYREALVRTFPYIIVYIIVYKIYKRKKEIFISSIHHAKKHPKKKYRK